jgi:hypothetical protein
MDLSEEAGLSQAYLCRLRSTNCRNEISGARWMKKRVSETALRPRRSLEQLFFDRLSGGFSMAETGLRRFLLLLFVDLFEGECRGGPSKSAYGISCQ